METTKANETVVTVREQVNKPDYHHPHRCMDPAAAERALVRRDFVKTPLQVSDNITVSYPCHFFSTHAPAIELRLYGFVQHVQLDAHLGVYRVENHLGFPFALSDAKTGRCDLTLTGLTHEARRQAHARNQSSGDIFASLDILFGAELGIYASSCMPLYVRFVPRTEILADQSTHRSRSVVVTGQVANAAAPGSPWVYRTTACMETRTTTAQHAPTASASLPLPPSPPVCIAAEPTLTPSPPPPTLPWVVNVVPKLDPAGTHDTQ